MSAKQYDRLPLKQGNYEPPRIKYKGNLKQFSGSPLGKDDHLDVLGILDH